MILDRFVQQPYDVRRRCIDYTPWLGDGEIITGVVVVIDLTTDPPLAVTDVTLDPTQKFVGYLVGGGLSGTDYKVSFRITTSDGQQREDDIELSVEET